MQRDHVRGRFSKSEGELLVSSARNAITNFLSTSRVSIPSRLSSDPRFAQKLGCFVTLNERAGTLRGCIGFAEPAFPLARALTHAAIAAATEDPRFRPVTLEEFGALFTEVSVLTTPEVIEVKSPRDLTKSVEVGRDGLILQWTYGSGLLLPQVAKEYDWDAEEFLINLSIKAGAPPDEWLVPGSVVLKFQAQRFRETSPDGAVLEE
ncbi:MAG: TIGR00296 family protein [Nitrososphaerales archaeon]